MSEDPNHQVPPFEDAGGEQATGAGSRELSGGSCAAARSGRDPGGEDARSGAKRSSHRSFDRVSALERMGGDPELFAVAAEAFLGHAGEILEQIREAVRSQDSAALVLSAHSIKGTAATFEARALTAEARRLEMLGRDGDLQGARDALADLEQELHRFADELATCLVS